ncbi:MAG: YccF domain-containing protein [Anaerolineales bacterium]|nr:YccF domain-containing protein [Anaerolineales bacterium]
MSCLGNLVWLVFGGFLSGLGYIIGGGLICLTIVGIPIGTQAIKLGIATMTPFGREIVMKPESPNPTELLLNILWAIFFGWEIFLSHILHGVLLAITIIGMPFALQHFKLAPLALFPFGRELT